MRAADQRDGNRKAVACGNRISAQQRDIKALCLGLHAAIQSANKIKRKVRWKRKSDKVVQRAAAHGRNVAYIDGQTFAAQKIRGGGVQTEMNGFVQDIRGCQEPVLTRGNKNSRVIADSPNNIRPDTYALAGNQLNQAKFTD